MNRARQREEQAKYDKRLKELHAELEATAHTLSEKQGQADQLRSDIAVILEQRDDYQERIKALEAYLVHLQQEAEAKDAERGRRVREATAQLTSLERRRKNEERKTEAALAAAKLARKKAKETADVLLTLDKAKQDLAVTTAAISGLQKESERIEKANAQATKGLDTREAAVDEKIARASKLRAETEKGLRTLEHYVKRLQRIYSKQGIKIDLLSQFNIVRDRT